MNLNLLSLLMMGAAIIPFFLAWYAWQRRHFPIGLSLFLLMLAAAVWAFFYGVELSLNRLSSMQIAVTLQYSGIATICVFWLIFAARYTGNDKWLTPQVIGLLFIIPVIVLGLCATNPLHHLFYASVELGFSHGYYFQKLQSGPFYKINVIYSYSCFIVGILLLFDRLCKESRENRGRILVLMTGALVPFALNLAYIMGFNPHEFLDLTPLAFVVMGIILVLGVFTMDLFNITPLALNLLFDRIPDAIIVTDTDGSIIKANASAQFLLQSKAGQPLLKMILMKKDKPGAALSETDLSAGDKIYGFTCSRIISYNGRELGTLVIVKDITARKKIETQTMQLQKARSVQRMAGSVAHNLNNQLTTVMGTLELVLSDLPADTKYRETLLRSMNAADKAADISRQMLGYLGQISGVRVPVNLSEICHRSLSHNQPAVPEGMALNVDFPDFGPIVLADADQIRQVLTNLFTNALESISYNQGCIGLNIRTVSHEDIPTVNRFPVDWQPQPVPYACLEVSDNGCGISREDVGTILDPYFSTKFPGRGMGLPVTMGILKTHSGCITVDSEPGSGSVFRIYLPVSYEKQRSR